MEYPTTLELRSSVFVSRSNKYAEAQKRGNQPRTPEQAGQELGNECGKKLSDLWRKWNNKQITYEEYRSGLRTIQKELQDFWHQHPKNTTEAMVNILSAIFRNLYTTAQHKQELQKLDKTQDLPQPVRVHLERQIETLEMYLKFEK